MSLAPFPILRFVFLSENAIRRAFLDIAPRVIVLILNTDLRIVHRTHEILFVVAHKKRRTPK